MLAALLVGPPGAGTSAVGDRLAARWGATLVDSDRELARRHGEASSDLLLRLGEPAFRMAEDAVAAELLTSTAQVVVLGGGAVLGPLAQEAVTAQARPVVLLSVGPAAAARRLGFDGARAAVPVNPRAALRAMLAERLPRYRAIAGHEVDTDLLTLDEVAEAVHQQIGVD